MPPVTKQSGVSQQSTMCLLRARNSSSTLVFMRASNIGIVLQTVVIEKNLIKEQFNTVPSILYHKTYFVFNTELILNKAWYAPLYREIKCCRFN